MSDAPEYSSAYKALTDYLDSNKYSYTPYPKENRVSFSFCGYYADYRVQFRITHDEDYFQLTIHFPFRVRDEKLRASVSDLITRANYKMLLGKFEMDLADGEILFHASHLIDGGIFTSETVERIYMTSIVTMDRYFPALMQHIHAGYTPEDAIFHAELDMHAEAVAEEPMKPKKKADPKPSTASSDEKPTLGASDPRHSTPATPDSSARPSCIDPRLGSSSKKPHKKKGEGGGSGQGELPL